MIERETSPNTRGAQTRQRVLEAAFEVVSERPLADVQLQHIADRAGLSSGHVLYHFGSKDGILIETLAWSESLIAEDRARELADLHEPAARLARWIVLFLPRSADDPTWKLWLELWLRSGSEEMRTAPKSVAESWVADVREILEDGLDRQVFRLDDDFDHFWTWAHALLVGLSIGVLIRIQTLEEATATALEIIGRELHITLS